MKLTAEDYRRNYAQMSDDEFLAIDRDELVDLARRCYDAELARRQLSAPPVTEETLPSLESTATSDHAADDSLPVVAPPMPHDEEAIQLAIVDSMDAARYALRTLHRANVPAYLTESPRVEGSYADACLGIMVAESCADSARELLAGQLSWSNQQLVRKWLERDWTPDGLDLNDFEVRVEEHFGEENKVAARITVSGVDPQTDGPVKLSGIAIVHLDDGNIGDRWIHLDEAES